MYIALVITFKILYGIPSYIYTRIYSYFYFYKHLDCFQFFTTTVVQWTFLSPSPCTHVQEFFRLGTLGQKHRIMESACLWPCWTPPSGSSKCLQQIRMCFPCATSCQKPPTALLGPLVSLTALQSILSPAGLPQIFTERSSQLQGAVLFCRGV